MNKSFGTTKSFMLSGNQNYSWKELKEQVLKGKLSLKSLTISFRKYTINPIKHRRT
jgi:hypothetical protein